MIACSSCGAPCEVSLSQRVAHDKLVWSASTTCLGQGHRTELDGGGVPPEPFRRRLIDERGMYELTVPAERDRLIALRQLQKALQLSMATLAQLRSQALLIFGTQCELEWLAAMLRSNGVPTHVAPRVPAHDGVDLATLLAGD